MKPPRTFTSWCLIPINVGRVCIEGYAFTGNTSEASFVVTSEVTDRKDSHRLFCTNGDEIVLSGRMQENIAVKAGVPAFIRTTFNDGFPEDWQHLVRKWTGSEKAAIARTPSERATKTKRRASGNKGIGNVIQSPTPTRCRHPTGKTQMDLQSHLPENRSKTVTKPGTSKMTPASKPAKTAKRETTKGTKRRKNDAPRKDTAVAVEGKKCDGHQSAAPTQESLDAMEQMKHTGQEPRHPCTLASELSKKRHRNASSRKKIDNKKTGPDELTKPPILSALKVSQNSMRNNKSKTMSSKEHEHVVSEAISAAADHKDASKPKRNNRKKSQHKANEVTVTEVVDKVNVTTRQELSPLTSQNGLAKVCKTSEIVHHEASRGMRPKRAAAVKAKEATKAVMELEEKISTDSRGRMPVTKKSRYQKRKDLPLVPTVTAENRSEPIPANITGSPINRHAPPKERIAVAKENVKPKRTRAPSKTNGAKSTTPVA